MLLGILAALTASFTWTIACFIWRSQTKYFSSVQINQVKNLTAGIIFLPVIFFIDWTSEVRYILILLLGGVIGIALGDSLYLEALKRLGTRTTLSIEAFSPVIANCLAILFLREFLSIKSWIGTFIVVFSLLLISQEKVGNEGNSDTSLTSLIKGFIFAFMSIACAIIGGILSRLVLVNSGLNPIQSTEIRIIGALIVLSPFIRLNFYQVLLKSPLKTRCRFFLATILGTNLGILLQQTVFMILPVGLAWTLLSLSPVIATLFARLEGEKVSMKGYLLPIFSFAGVVIALT